MDIESLGNRVIGLAIEVHKNLGLGLLESAYERCLAEEMALNGINYKTQVPVNIVYKGMQFDEGFRIDILVEDTLILELKSVNEMNQIYVAQLLTYLKLTNLTVGYLINFNSLTLKNGLRRVVNNYTN